MANKSRASLSSDKLHLHSHTLSNSPASPQKPILIEASQTTPAAQARNAARIADDENLSHLPDTIPESIQIEYPAFPLKEKLPTPMNSLEESLEKIETQLFTPSQIAELKKNAKHGPIPLDTLAETQHEGDPAYLDFGIDDDEPDLPQSLLIPVSQNDAEVQEQDELPSSPYQAILPRSPESRGKKRSRDGSPIESQVQPATVSKNPFFNATAETPGKAFGLTQAFGQTQAATSPPEGLPSVRRSDRPSPGIAIEKFPAREVTISPFLDVFQSDNEPGRYISSHESQLRRGELSSERKEQSQDDDEDSWPVRIRSSALDKSPTRPRSSQDKHDARPFSSPQKRSAGRTSILKRSASARPAMEPQTSFENLPSSPPLRTSSPVNDLPEDEVDETQDDINKMAISEAQDPAQAIQVDHSPKNRRRTIVPATEQKVIKQSVAPFPPTQGSPTVRVQAARNTDNSIVILSSQKSLRSTQTRSRLSNLKSTIQDVDRIPASPSVDAVPTQSPDRGDRAQSPLDRITPEPSMVQLTGEEDTRMFASTIPETIVSSRSNGQQDESELPAITTTKASTKHATAQEESSQPVNSGYPRQRQPIKPASQEASQQPTTKTGQKRRRMDDFSQDEAAAESLHASQTDALAADILKGDFETAQLMNDSPVRKRLRHFEPLNDISPRQRQPNHVKSVSPAILRTPSPEPLAEVITEDVAETTTATDEEPATRQSRRSKRSTWEIEDSPRSTLRELPTAPKLQPMSKSRLKRPVRNGSTKTKHTPEPMPSIEEASPEPKKVAIESVDETPATAEVTTDAASFEVKAPNMVFAYFMDSTRAYYPATCLGRDDTEETFTVAWPGYDPELMKDHQLCALDLRIGDEVKVALKDFPGVFIVRGFSNVDIDDDQPSITDIYGNNAVLLEAKQRKNDRVKPRLKNTVLIRDIFITLNTFTPARQRSKAYKSADVTDIPTDVVTPPIRLSTPATPSSRGRNAKQEDSQELNPNSGLFTNMVFALSFEDQHLRDKVKTIVRTNGGTILESSFQELLANDMTLKPKYAEIGFAALLADRHSRKPKYMEALALGLLCLSGQWAVASIELNEPAPWQDHLLPAGESTLLNGAVRSRIMPSTFDPNEKLSATLAQRKPFFNEARAIFVTGKGKTAEKRASHYFLAQVMGITDVEKVADIAAAKEQLSSTEDEPTWLFVDDRDRKAGENMLAGLSQNGSTKSTKRKRKSDDTNGVDERTAARHWIADSEFLLQSLILGRLMP